MKKMRKIDTSIVINVYSFVGMFTGLYYLYVCFTRALEINNTYSSLDDCIILLGVVVPIFIVGFCLYFFIKKENSNRKFILIFSIILLVFGFLQLLVNKIDVIRSLYFLFDNRFKYTLYFLGILPIIYLLLSGDRIKFKK